MTATNGPGTLLAIDSCGTSPGAALWDGIAAPRVLELGEHPPRAEGLADCVQRLLDVTHRNVASIRCLAVLSGPGSYTGLRTGLAFVRGLALLENLPVAPVSALERLAFCAGADGDNVIAVWQGSANLVVAGAYRMTGGVPVEVEAGGVFEPTQLDDFVSRCIETCADSPVIVTEQAQQQALPPDVVRRGLAWRMVDSQNVDAVARIGYAKHVAGLGVSADSVLPDYLGTSLPRRNRNRVAAPFAGVTC